MKTTYSPDNIIGSGLCIGCGICVAYSGRNDTTMQFDTYGNLKPIGPKEWLRHSSADFSEICPFSPLAKNEDDISATIFPKVSASHVSIGRYIRNYVGHVSENEYRKNGSSGGMVSWVACQLLKKNLIDGLVHVKATENPQSEGKYFKYHISRNEKDIHNGAKSRYYPVELSEVLKVIQEVPGRYAVVAVPCMIKAIHLLRFKNPIYRDRIRFTLGLFCGHMKSSHFVESIEWQMNVKSNQVKNIDFRNKKPERPANWYNSLLKLHNGESFDKDWWNMVDGDWGAGFFMNSACNYCDDVVAETADISFGDAWLEPYASDGKGNNVIITRSETIDKIIQEGMEIGTIHLEEVSAEFTEKTQAAGLRQRREGLAYRLSWRKNNIMPLKRVLPKSEEIISKERKTIYKMRFYISKYSHLIFKVAKKLKLPFIYIYWARVVTSIYYALAYKKANIQEMRNRYISMKSTKKGRND